MINKDKDWKKEYEEIKNEIIFEKVSKAIKNNPNNWRYNIDKIGLIWTEEDDYEEIKEENDAQPKNKNQKELVAYFTGKSLFIKKLDILHPMGKQFTLL
ncbi:MAG TPA: hypothetical protein ENJ51_10715 [Leucothrix mucor]|uniref:Uncharacterized protein n=1 Tax=Leucothrix mucor TaxID=45248 RepID=A0A7V2T4L2_LEUMU|nr:hypothetical protein [Leucothrix mucor]